MTVGGGGALLVAELPCLPCLWRELAGWLGCWCALLLGCLGRLGINGSCPFFVISEGERDILRDVGIEFKYVSEDKVRCVGCA